jgi:choline dehydrogenase-like flavoprotein
MAATASAPGGIVAKELAEAALSVVLLERGKWYMAFDRFKDDLRNQRTSVLGSAFGRMTSAIHGLQWI